MNKIIIPAIGLLFLLASCQKEVSVDLGGAGGGAGGGGGAVGDLLVRVGSKIGSDSSTNFYEYDASKRLVRQISTSPFNGASITSELRIVRNASGIITSTIQKSSNIPDSIVSRVLFNTASGRYLAKVREISIGGQTVSDSTVFVFDASGKVVQEDEYLYNDLLPPTLTAKTLFTYNPSGNLTTIKIVTVDPFGGPDQDLIEISATYDTKKSPLIMTSGDAAIIGDPSLCSINNPLTFDYKDIANAGAGSFLLTFTHTYNSQTKPATSITLETPANTSTASTYYYK